MISEKKYECGLIRAVVGLGNPGGQYYKTRHSIGFRILDAFADRNVLLWNKNSDMEYSSFLTAEQKTVYLIKPLTFMNNSGRVIPFLTKKGITGDQILVIHDELEKSFGDIKIRWDGGHRGHNGLRSIMEVFGNDFWRLQFGIGRPQDKSQVSDYVLSQFSQQEEVAIAELIYRALLLLQL